MRPTSYILPIRSSEPPDDELIRYVRDLSLTCEVIVVDGSPAPVFEAFAAGCERAHHVRPDADLSTLINGKVAGVLTGLRLASHEHVVIADDDVRYDAASLAAVVSALDEADVVRPQNYFEPLPWHARVDTARTLINRITGGDWPGTLAVRRSILRRTNGYDGNVMFENLELVRTVVAAGGRERMLRGVYVRRLPPSAQHFVSQRVRQAYDELARPARLALWLSVLPLLVFVASRFGAGAALAALLLPAAVAEAGRRVDRGAAFFPPSASAMAPFWLLERGIAVWLAVAARAAWGGVPYRGRIVRRAATPMRELRRRHAGTTMSRSSTIRRTAMRLLSHLIRITGITTALIVALSLPTSAQGERSEHRFAFQVDRGQPLTVTVGPVKIGTVTITNLGRGYGRGGLNLRSAVAGSELSTMLRIEMDASNPRDEEWEVTATVEFLDRDGKIIDRVVKKDNYEGEDGVLRIEHPMLEYVLPLIGDVRLTLQGRRR